jgi:hypothetical protein
VTRDEPDQGHAYGRAKLFKHVPVPMIEA